MELLYIGHSAFLVDGEIAFDPWLDGNPMAAVKEISPKLIFVSHDHRDHGLEDAIRMSKKYRSKIIGMFELAQHASERGAVAEGANIGGWFNVDGKEVFLTPAIHSSTLGNPCGFIVKTGGKTIYHAGDTSLFSEMEFLSNFNIDVALLPIGGRYTMDVNEAAKAVELLNPKLAIPMHYNTFPQIRADPQKFKELASCDVAVMEPGQRLQV